MTVAAETLILGAFQNVPIFYGHIGGQNDNTCPS